MTTDSGTLTGPSERSTRETQVDSIAQTLRDVRGDDSEASTGVFSERIDEIEPLLCAFGRALGGDPAGVSELPFTEESGTDGMPEPLYVRHDEAMLSQVTSWLLQRQHIGLISPYGTGKTALREIARRDLGGRDDFVVAAMDNAASTTPRALYESVLRAGYDAGYEIDTDDYWQVDGGVPWATDEVKDAVGRLCRVAETDDTTVLLLVDELEDFPTELLGPLQTAADAGVRLFLTGTPAGKDRLVQFRETLDSRVHYYEGIDPFGPDDIAEYIGRSLSYSLEMSYDGGVPPLFSSDAIADIHDRTGGNPRAVRSACVTLFARAAFLWDRTGADADRITITPALRDRSRIVCGT